MLAVVVACALGCVVTGAATRDFWGCGSGFAAGFDAGLGEVVLAGNRVPFTLAGGGCGLFLVGLVAAFFEGVVFATSAKGLAGTSFLFEVVPAAVFG